MMLLGSASIVHAEEVADKYTYNIVFGRKPYTNSDDWYYLEKTYVFSNPIAFVGDSYWIYEFSGGSLKFKQFGFIISEDFVSKSGDRWTPHSGYGHSILLYPHESYQGNVPIFSTIEDAEKYFINGDDSGILNKPDYENISTYDDTFGLTGFTADNTITASWTGTTHDDKASEYAEMFVELTAGYAYIEAPGQVVTTEPYVGEYLIADKTFTKLRSELEVTDETLFLRCLKVTPYYKYESGWLSTPYKGVPSYVYLNPDGSLDSIDTGEDNYVVEDTTFYLKNVSATYTGGSYIFGESQKQIYWSGTSKDSLLGSVPPEDTLVVVCFVGYDENLNTKIFSYEELCEYKLGMTLNDIRIKRGWNNTSNSFTFYTDTAFEMLEGQGYTFDGEVLLYPFFTLDGVLYEGRCSVVNVVNGEIKEIITDKDGNQEEVIIKPPETDSDGNVSGGGNDFAVGDIGDAPSYMLNLLNAFMGLIGAVPNLLSAVFPFLPIEIIYLISSGLVVAVIMRILGR